MSDTPRAARLLSTAAIEEKILPLGRAGWAWRDISVKCGVGVSAELVYRAWWRNATDEDRRQRGLAMPGATVGPVAGSTRLAANNEQKSRAPNYRFRDYGPAVRDMGSPGRLVR